MVTFLELFKIHLIFFKIDISLGSFKNNIEEILT